MGTGRLLVLPILTALDKKVRDEKGALYLVIPGVTRSPTPSFGIKIGTRAEHIFLQRWRIRHKLVY